MKIYVFALLLVAGASILFVWRQSETDVSYVEVDRRMRHAYGAYVTNSFKEVTNEFRSYVSFLETMPEHTRKVRDREALLYIAYQKLAYLEAAVGNVDTACELLTQAYQIHQRQAVHARFRVTPRTNFVLSVTKGVEAVDAQTGARWRAEVRLEADELSELTQKFHQVTPR